MTFHTNTTALILFQPYSQLIITYSANSHLFKELPHHTETIHFLDAEFFILSLTTRTILSTKKYRDKTVIYISSSNSVGLVEMSYSIWQTLFSRDHMSMYCTHLKITPLTLGKILSHNIITMTYKQLRNHIIYLSQKRYTYQLIYVSTAKI